MGSLGDHALIDVIQNMFFHKRCQVLVLMKREVSRSILDLQITVDRKCTCADRTRYFRVRLEDRRNGFRPDIHFQLCSCRDRVDGLSAFRNEEMDTDRIISAECLAQEVDSGHCEIDCI